MFRRLREAKRVLTYRQTPNAQDRPDITEFVADGLQATKAGRTIGGIVEVFVIFVLLGATLHRVFFWMFGGDHSPTVSLAVVGVLSVAMLWAINAITDKFNRLAMLKLRIQERVAPFFGHRIDRTLRTLRH